MIAPRYFRDDELGASWMWNGREVLVFDEFPSLFSTPDELLAEQGIYETDAAGNPLEPTPADVAAERGDRQQQQEADES